MNTKRDYLKEETRKLLPSAVPADLTLVDHNEIIFLTAVFEGGEVLGFWSHSPWSRVHNMEQGWAVYDASKTEIACLTSCETRSYGETPSRGFGDPTFAEWRAQVKKTFGPARKLCPEGDNENFWKIET